MTNSGQLPDAGTLQDLLTTDVGEPESVYERLLEHLHALTGGLAVFFRGVEAEGGVVYDSMRLAGNAERDQLAAELDGMPLLNGPTLHVEAPSVQERSSFILLDVDERFHGSEVWEKFFEPRGIHGFIRMLAYQDRRFLGHVGVYQHADDPPVSRVDLHRFQERKEVIVAALASADFLIHQQISEEGTHVIVNARGQVEFAAQGARVLLTRRRRARLVDMVQRLDAGDYSACTFVLDGIDARLTRLEGRGCFLYLATLSPPRTATIDPLACLTESQREIAAFAAAGATANEIARSLDRSPHTIRTHLKNIYARLEICSRTELAALVEPQE